MVLVLSSSNFRRPFWLVFGFRLLSKSSSDWQRHPLLLMYAAAAVCGPSLPLFEIIFSILILFFPSRGAHTHGERVKKNTRGQNFLLFLFFSSPSPQYKVTPSVSFLLSLCSSFLADTHMCFSLSHSLPTTSSRQMSTEKKKDRNTHAPIHIHACQAKKYPAMASSLSTTKFSSLSLLTCPIFSLRLARPLALSAGIDDGGIKTCT